MVLNLKAPSRRTSRTGTSKMWIPARYRYNWRYLLSKRGIRIGAAAFLILSTVFLGVFAYFYIKYERIVDQRMRGQIFSTAAKIYANPAQLRVGDAFDAREVMASLRRAGYDEEAEGSSPSSTIGTFKLVRH